VMSTASFHDWFGHRRDTNRFEVNEIPFDDLRGWYFEPSTGDLVHETGQFFRIEGIEVTTDYGPVAQWRQPIINQPEVGILGIVVREIDGVLHCLMQCKMEPGNPGMVQLSPTVQATRSNYMRVHKGSPIKYLEYFVGANRAPRLVDVLQSEQGAWFLQKRNRNMVVEVTEDIPVDDEFCWLTLGQLRTLMTFDNLVNMDARTVLSCIPFAGPRLMPSRLPGGNGRFQLALMRSLEPEEGALHTTGDLLSWFTETKTRYERHVSRVGLAELKGWQQTDREIREENDRHFRVVAVDVSASNREVGSWTQPLFAPRSRGVIAFITKQLHGVLHVLVNARVEPGYLDVAELAPTVQCMPDNYAGLGEDAKPPFLSYVLNASPQQIHYDAIQSEEGGRFLDAENRYVVIEAYEDFSDDIPEDYRWMTLNQISTMLQHSHYLNVQARSLIACTQSLW
jgi:dTDP-4-dehydro-6-deoxy-alpha-D-glucopyranose 2,3-dehydratase